MSGPWERYAAAAPAAEEGPWTKYAAAAAPAPPAAPEEVDKSSVLDAPNAVATGYNRNMARLAGLPVDTVANGIDLLKAIAGTGYREITGKPIPKWLELVPRSEVIGSGEHIIEAMRKTPLTKALVDPQNPEYEGGYLQAAGGGLTAVMRPESAVQAVNQALLGLSSAVAGKGVADATGDPALAIAASMVPMGLQQAAVAGAQRAVRGGEAGRRNMEQRVQDLRNAGIENPTLGLASGNQVIGGVENVLQSTPGAVTTMRVARDNAITGLHGKVQDTANLASPNRGALAAGSAMQRGLQGFKDDFKATQGQLYNNVEQQIGSQFPTPTGTIQRALSTVNAGIPGAPAMSRFFQNGKLMALEDAVAADVAKPAQALAGAGVSQSINQGTLPFQAVKQARTMVGNEMADATFGGDVSRSKWKPIYAAMSDDMHAAAQQAGPKAEQTFDRANAYTRAGHDRIERVAPFADAQAPEQAFKRLEQTTKENVSTLRAVKKSLPPEARAVTAATIIDRLGRARPGQQNETGDVFSTETFLTNWNGMTQQARAELFSGFPNAVQVRRDIESVAKATAMMRDNSKLWANPSGTAANLGARGTLGAVGAGAVGAAAGFVPVAVPVGGAVSLGGTKLMAKGLTSKAVRELMMERGAGKPYLTRAQINELVASGLLQDGHKDDRDADE